MEIKLSVNVAADLTLEFLRALKDMQAKEVVAGFPEGEGEERKDSDGNPSPINNATLGYIHNTGSPEANIPARPFMVEGIEGVQDEIVGRLKDVARAAVDGNSRGVDMGLHAVGLTAQAGIRDKINEGPFEPLAEGTLKARERRGIE